MIAYKLIRQRKDGTLGPLFIGRKTIIPIGKWLKAKNIPTKGFAFRPGWHCCNSKSAPHLKQGKETNRIWVKVEIKNYTIFDRPENQGGQWYIAEYMKVLNIEK